MSRSQRNRKEKNGVFITFAVSESNKKDKTIANRKFRRRNKININDLDKPLNTNIREISDVYDFNSDGLAQYRPFNDNIFLTEEENIEYSNLLKKYKRK